MKMLITLLILAFTGTSFGQTFPSNEYDILNKMSIFSRDRTVGGPTTKPVIVATRPFIPIPPPIFIGVMITDTEVIGVLETPTKTVNFQVGDTLEWNGVKVQELTLNSMKLSNNTTVLIGNNLRNEPSQLATAQPWQSLDAPATRPSRSGTGTTVRPGRFGTTTGTVGRRG